MTKINRAKELVDSHTTEEVLEWMEGALKRGAQSLNGEIEDPAFLLGQCSVNIAELRDVVIALNEKLSPKGPVVA